MTEIDRLLAEAERHLGDEPLAGEDMGALQSRLLRAQHAVLRAQIKALRMAEADEGPLPPVKGDAEKWWVDGHWNPPGEDTA